MPRLDGTGPQGMGPRTGRGFGPCGGGLRKMFRGRNWRGFSPRTREPENEQTALRAEAEELEQELRIVKERLARFDQSEQ